MSEVRPRSVIHRGRMRAAAFFLSFEIVSEEDAARRIYSAWQPGARLYRFPAGFLLVLSGPVLVSATEAIGLPLVWSRGFLASAPLSETETKRAVCAPGSITRVEGGRLMSERLNDAIVEAPETWISTAEMEFASGLSLGSKAAIANVVGEAKPLDIRQTLGGIPPRASELSPFLEQLDGEGAAGTGWFRRFSIKELARSIRGLWAALAGLRAGTAPQSPGSTGSNPRVLPRQSSSRFSLWLNSAISRLVMVTQLYKALGWRQGRYLSRLLDMFEQGNMDEVLRHAIPLSSISNSPALRVCFGLPAARRSLNISLFGQRPASAMALGESLYFHLQQRYRAAFQRLEAQGRIEEAAFVLAELLRCDEEAVAFLERHGKLREAAEIAEGRELSPEIVVRQWFVAGDKERAIQIARKTGAFHGTVLRLEKSRDPAAAELRKLWAQSLAESGNPGAAIDVLWPLESERFRALEWMRGAVEIGGRPGARTLARLMSVSISEFEYVRERALVLLENESLEEAPARMEFADTLCKQLKSPETQTLARLAARAMLRDTGEGLLGDILLRQLVHYSGDSALRADVPPAPKIAKAELDHSRSPRHYLISAMDRGTTQISEAALLPNGTCLLALGEVGLKLLTRDGRTIAHFDEPAERLVVSENGNRVIALARRDEVWRLSKVDIQSRRVTSWCHAEISRFTSTFDGGTWYLASGQDLYAIDATSHRFDALWRIPDLGQFAGPLTLASSGLHFVTYGDGNFWLWEYQLPGMRLTDKSLLPFTRRMASVAALQLSACPQSGVLDSSTEAAGTQRMLFKKSQGSWLEFHSLDAEEHVWADSVVAGNWLGVSLKTKDQTRVLIYSFAKNEVPVQRIEVVIEGQSHPQIRFDSSTVTIADELGRLRVFELLYGNLIRDLTI